MSNNNLAALILLLLLAFSGTDAKPNVVPRPNVVNYELLQAEGNVACLVAKESNPSDFVEVKTPATTCTCNGTKQIKSGDGQGIFPCPCENCTCKKKVSASGDEYTSATVSATASEVVKNLTGTTCFVFTDPSWCAPCRQLEQSTFPTLKKAGWSFSNDPTDNKATFIVLDDEHPLYKDFDFKNLNKIPLFIIVRNGEFVETFSGYIDAVKLADKLNKLSK